MRAAFAGFLGVTLGAACATCLCGAGEISRSEYRDRLHGMWLGESLANWTGLTCEGRRQAPPFFTDANWGDPIGNGQFINFVILDPWQADDDTDVEYVYLHLMSTLGHNLLTPAEISAGWTSHINRYIWVSNQQARTLIGQNVTPPSTGLFSGNIFSLMIDAQLTTEIFGAFTPGMPEEMLRLSLLPIETTASGYAVHAAQFYAALYSLAARVDRNLSGRDQAIWLVREARKFIPDSSKTAGLADLVLADFLANPDPNDWERTRDLIASIYQTNAAANGWVFRAWYESSVNFADGVMCLLYGQMDYKRTLQIGTLSGWDADNPTATMGGLIGLVKGTQAIRDAFPGQTLSDRFNIYRTRDNLPDYLPADPAAQDTFQMLADRSMAMVDRAVVEAGGIVDLANDRYILPEPVWGRGIDWNPSQQLDGRSANLRFLRNAQPILVTSSEPWPVGAPPTNGASYAPFIGNGLENDFSGREVVYGENRPYDSGDTGSPPVLGKIVTLQIVYPAPVEVHTVRFIGGPSIRTGPTSGWGGWFDSIQVELQIGGTWVPQTVMPSEPLDPTRPWQLIDFVLASPVEATGVRVKGPAGGGRAFVTCAELDALSRPRPPCVGDLNGDRVSDDSDFVLFASSYDELLSSFGDFNRDGVTDDADFVLFAAAYDTLECP